MATTTSRSERPFGASARREFIAAALFGLLALGACRERTPAPLVRPPRPAPSPPTDLVFQGEIGQPEAFYRLLGGLVSPAIVGNVSSRWEPAAVALTDLPQAVGERLDPAGPIFLLGLGSEAEFSPVVVARVQSGEEIVALLTQGRGAPRRAARRKDGVVLLPPADGTTAVPALAVAEGFVVASPNADALERAAAYAVHGFSSEPRRAPDLQLRAPKAALAGPLRKLIAARWAAARSELERAAAELTRERGRAADFADPGAVLALLDGVARGVDALLASSSSLSIRLVPLDDRLEITLELEPQATGAAAELARALRPASLEPLARLPAESAVAVSFRPALAAEVPVANEPAAHDLLRGLFGSRLTPREGERVSAFLAKAERDAPDVRAFALLSDRTFVYREERLGGAPGTDLAGAVALLELRAFAERFRALFGKQPVEWSSSSREATLAAGPSARTVVGVAGRTPNDVGLGLSPALRARHEPAALVLHVELSRLGVGTASAPVLLSLTRRSRAISLRLEFSRGASHAVLERILRR